MLLVILRMIAVRLHYGLLLSHVRLFNGNILTPEVSKHCFTSLGVLKNVIQELELYKTELLDKPAVLLVNKMDKPGSKEIFEEVSEAVKDLEGVCCNLPAHIRPVCPIQFMSVIPIAAKYQSQDVEDLKITLRNILDLVYDVDGVKKETELLHDLQNKTIEKGPLLV